MATDLSSPAKRRNLKRRLKPYSSPITKGIAVLFRFNKAGAVWVASTPSGTKVIAPAVMMENDPPDAIGWSEAVSRTMERARAEAAAKERDANATLTVGQALDEYAEAAFRSGKTADAMVTLRSNCKLIETDLGERRVGDLTLRDLVRWRDGLAAYTDDKGKYRTRAPATINRVRATLVAALNRTGLDGPWQRFPIIKGASKSRDIAFAAEELEVLVAASYEVDQRFGELVATLALLGCRYGEAAALRVDDVSGTTLRIRGGKTGARKVMLNTEAARHLRAIAGDRGGQERLLRQRGGRVWQHGSYRKAWAAALVGSGLDLAATIYSLRHSYITLAVYRGVPLAVIARTVGTGVRMLEAHYAHAIDEMERQALAPLEGMIKVGPMPRVVS